MGLAFLSGRGHANARHMCTQDGRGGRELDRFNEGMSVDIGGWRARLVNDQWDKRVVDLVMSDRGISRYGTSEAA